ncbi:MAG: serine hydrolase [Saprospiraceae bacterium]
MKPLQLILFLLLTTNLLFGQQNEDPLQGIDQDIEFLWKAYEAAGLSVAVVKDDQIVYAKGFGYRDVEQALPVTPDTKFPIASVSKAFTASLLGILESEGKVSLTEKPSSYIPKLQFHTDEMNNLIQIEDLLSHKSGIGGVNGTLVLFPETDKLKTMSKLKYIALEGAVNDSWIYSNMGYTVAGTVVEQVAEESWDSYLEKSIFQPLKMTNSLTSLQQLKNSDNFACGYGLLAEKNHKTPYEEYYSYAPAGGIKSTANDLSNWVITWLNQGKFAGQQILPADYVKNASSIHNIRPQGGADADTYLFGDGFGWRVESLHGHYKVHHGGNTSGFSTHVVMFPFSKVGIIVLVNQENSLLPYMITHRIASKMLDFPQAKLAEYPVIISELNTIDKEIKGVNLDKKPSFALSGFIGKYNHPGYGTFEVVQEKEALYIVFPALKFGLEHIHYNTFRMRGLDENSRIINPEYFELDFLIDKAGNVGSVEMNLQSEPVEFIKKEN